MPEQHRVEVLCVQCVSLNLQVTQEGARERLGAWLKPQSWLWAEPEFELVFFLLSRIRRQVAHKTQSCRCPQKWFTRTWAGSGSRQEWGLSRVGGRLRPRAPDSAELSPFPDVSAGPAAGSWSPAVAPGTESTLKGLQVRAQ